MLWLLILVVLASAQSDSCVENSLSVATISQTGLFQSPGPMNPHAYRPNEFVINNWIYDGFVSFGRDGTILPALASSWVITNNGIYSVISFQLRRNVRFSDGAAWNATVAA